MDYSSFPAGVVEDIVRLRRRIEAARVPEKQVDYNLLIATWNIRNFGGVYGQFEENPDSPKRNLRALAYISEVIRRFDVIAVQEVKADTSGIRLLLRDFLGSDWGMIASDVTAGARGNLERLAFLYDKRRVQPSGLAGELVLPPVSSGDPQQQFDRTPYIVGFQSAHESFALLTAHIRYGAQPAERLPELQSFAQYVAGELRTRAKGKGEETNLIVLGDFNIDDRGDNPLFRAFVSSGLVVPEELLNVKSTYNTKPKYYDQIAWFMGDLDLPATGRAGSVDFAGAVFKEQSLSEMTYRMSDHFPLWVEFITERSSERMAGVLGVDAAAPNPFGAVPD